MLAGGIGFGSALEVFYLPVTRWEDCLALQQRLVYEISGQPRRRRALVICEHQPVITVGRQGSRGHILLEEEELAANQLSTRWCNRGGGVWFQRPGQLAAYPILPLEPPRFGLAWLSDVLHRTIVDVLAEFGVVGAIDRDHGGVLVGDRQIAAVGVAVKHWTSYHGCVLNVSLPPGEAVQFNPNVANRKSTCLLRERTLPVRMTAVREAVARHLAANLGLDSVLPCPPPALAKPAKVLHVARA